MNNDTPFRPFYFPYSGLSCLLVLLLQCIHIQGDSRLVDITAGGDFLGLCDQKIHINMCPILDGYGVMTA